MAVELHPHQQRALEKMHHGCVLRGGVGSGKTITALAYFYTAECGGRLGTGSFGGQDGVTKPTDIYVITTARKRDELDWEKEAAAFGISKENGGGIPGITLKVDSWNNIVNYTAVRGAFFVFDEQRLVGSGAWVQAFLKLAKNNRWIMLSATPGDNWMDYIPIFVANGFYKNRAEFISRHVVWHRFTKYPKVDRFIEEEDLKRFRNRVLVEMPFQRHTRRHLEPYIVSYDKGLLDVVLKDRWHIYEERPLVDAAEMLRVGRRLVNSDPSRLGAVMKLSEVHDRLIIFYNFDYELMALRTLGDILSITTAEYNGHKHQDVPTGDKWLYLVQYTAGSEAWNCITTNAIVMYSLNYSYKIYEQVQGRIDRLNTPYTDLYYYILRSGSSIDRSIALAIALKKNFNQNKFKEEMWDERQTKHRSQQEAA